jgi:Uma2 family endonuclease
MAVVLTRRTFTVGEYYKMAEAGILQEGDRVELIEGEILKMTPIGSRHTACVNKLNYLFAKLFGDEVMISVQNPLRLGDISEPEPDVALLVPRPDFYAERHPNARNALLVVEVADSSVVYDCEVKLPMYARAGLPEAWLVDLAQQQVLVHRNPTSQGYQEVHAKRSGDRLAAKELVIELAVDNLLL